MFLSWHKEHGGNRTFSPTTDDELREQTLTVMEKRNIVGEISAASIDLVHEWREAAPQRVIPALVLDFGNGANFSPEDLGELRAQGRLAVLGEVVNQYAGIEPGDSQMDPYWAAAEYLDIPVQIHVGPGPPGAPYLGFPDYRARMHSPLLLEEPLMRHPRLRLYVAHAGWPMLDDMLALLWTHPRGLRRRGHHQLRDPHGRVPSVPAGLGGGGVRQPGDVRIRSDGLAGCHRVRHRVDHIR